MVHCFVLPCAPLKLWTSPHPATACVTFHTKTQRCLRHVNEATALLPPQCHWHIVAHQHVYSVRCLACTSLLVKQKAVSGVFIMSRLTSPARLDTRSATSAAPCNAACPSHLLSPSPTSDGNSLMRLLHTIQHRHGNNSLLERTGFWNNLYPTRVSCVVCDETVYSDGTPWQICNSCYRM